MQNGRHLLEEYPRIGEVRMGPGALGLEPRQTMHIQFLVQHASHRFATSATFAYPENILDIVGPSQ